MSQRCPYYVEDMTRTYSRTMKHGTAYSIPDQAGRPCMCLGAICSAAGTRTEVSAIAEKIQEVRKRRCNALSSTARGILFRLKLHMSLSCRYQGATMFSTSLR